MASSDEESSVCLQKQNKLTLQFSSQGNAAFQHVTTTYEGGDTYSVVANYGGDPDRVVLAGGSAGGHLAALLSLARPEEWLSEDQRDVADWSVVYSMNRGSGGWDREPRSLGRQRSD